MSTHRRFHTDTRTSENFTEPGLMTNTGQKPSKWGRYCLKELLDNALDFSNETSEIAVDITTEGPSYSRRATTIAVEDNGPGIGPDRLTRIFENVGAFGGTKRHYARTDRGNQGNALMTILGIQYLCDGALRLETAGTEYRIEAHYNAMQGEYETRTEGVGESDVEGTRVEVTFGEKASTYTRANRVRDTFDEFVALNPHAEFRLVVRDADGDGGVSKRRCPKRLTIQLTRR